IQTGEVGHGGAVHDEGAADAGDARVVGDVGGVVDGEGTRLYDAADAAGGGGFLATHPPNAGRGASRGVASLLVAAGGAARPAGVARGGGGLGWIPQPLAGPLSQVRVPDAHGMQLPPPHVWVPATQSTAVPHALLSHVWTALPWPRVWPCVQITAAASDASET